ncbi:MAG TPA: hypothetical protein VJT74_14050 [Pyrinomonadaceae bacterium]|nr:hypothetical protein [Pyrinomonadaceae bacterium]
MKLLRSLAMVAIVLAACAASSFAQKKTQQPLCPLKQAPAFQGFQLGMTLADVKDMLADTSMFEAKISSNKIGAQALRLSGAELKEEFAEGVDDVNLTFVDKRLAVVRVSYHSGVWFGAKDFFKQNSEKLGIPEPSTTDTSRDRGGERYKVACVGFSATLAYSFGVSPNVTVADAEAQRLVEERAEKNPDGEVKTIGITPPASRRPRPNPPR